MFDSEKSRCWDQRTVALSDPTLLSKEIDMVEPTSSLVFQDADISTVELTEAIQKLGEMFNKYKN